MEDKKYELVGILNYFGVVPDIVYPIFKDEEGDYYGAFCDDKSPYIDNFILFPTAKEQIKNIKKLSKTHNTFEIDPEKEYYQVGDLAILAIQTSKKDVYIGTIDKYVNYAKELRYSVERRMNSLNGSRWQAANIFVDDLKRVINDCEVRLQNVDKKSK